jgi:hypothetical protein
VKAADHERTRYRAKLQRIYIRRMIGGKRQSELRVGWASFIGNMKEARVVQWDRRRLLRLAWRQLRTENEGENSDAGQRVVTDTEKQLVMGQLVRQRLGGRLAAREEAKRSCFLKWKRVL